MSVPYHSTATRPDWDDLPEVVQAVIETRLGARVRWTTTAGGGFTRGFAAVLTLHDGRHVFVKAADDHRTPIAWDSYRTEAAVLGWLPKGVPAPALQWSLDEKLGGRHWMALGIDAVEGELPGFPWTERHLALVVAAVEQTAEALAEPPEDRELTDLAVDVAADKNAAAFWPSVVAGETEAPSEWARAHARDLAALVDAAPEAVRGTAAVHGDLRADNVIVGRDEAWICDWNWLGRGAAFTDLATVLAQAQGGGLDATAAFTGSALGAHIEPDRLDAWLAYLAALYLLRAAEPERPNSSPWLPIFRREYAAACLQWLKARRGA